MAQIQPFRDDMPTDHDNAEKLETARRIARAIHADPRTLEKIADQASLSPHRLGLLLTGTVTPMPAEIFRLGLVLNVEPKDLMPNIRLGDMGGPMLRLLDFLRNASSS